MSPECCACSPSAPAKLNISNRERHRTARVLHIRDWNCRSACASSPQRL